MARAGATGETGGNTGAPEVAAHGPAAWKADACGGLKGDENGEGWGVKGLGGRTGSAARAGLGIRTGDSCCPADSSAPGAPDGMPRCAWT